MISGEYRTLAQFERRGARFRSYLLGRTAICGALTLGIATGIAPRAAKAGPQGSVVVGGAVDMQQAGTHTEFTQRTQTAILNHNSFDIKVNESVNFAQPNASSLAVNRVVGSDLPTSIAGKLTANGNVWVLNPSGVAVQGTAQVNVGGLVATTAGISDEAIMAGQRSFAGAPDGSAVTNAGSITAGGGSVVLVAPVVRNSGTITAKGSDVALGAGSGFTVDFDGDGLTRFEVTPGNGVNLTNTGTISAQGGAAYLSAASAEAVQTSVVSIGGKVEATRIEEKGGVIVISGGDKGVTEVSGEVDASQAAGDGGRVIVTGDLVDVEGTAQIDASGAEDGGTVEIGGAFQGGAIASDVVLSAGAPATTPLPTAKRTLVRDGAQIAANAGKQGDGGEVIVWADEATAFRGNISARGGAQGGDGGNAEVSGKIHLAFDGEVDLGAAAGGTGTLLLDPRDINIVLLAGAHDGQLAADTPDAGDPAGTVFFNDSLGDDFDISATAIAAAGANVLLQATRDINVNTPVTSAFDLDFQAGNNINLNNSITTTGALQLTADAAFTSLPSDGSGTIVFSGGSLSAAAMTLSAGSTLQLGNLSLTGSGGQLLIATSNDPITQGVGTSIAASDHTTTVNAGTGDITLANADNDFSGNSTRGIALSGGAVQVNDTDSMVVRNTTAASLVATADAGLAVSGTVSVTGNATLDAGTLVDINSNSSVSTGGNLVIDANGNRFGLGVNSTASAAGTLTVQNVSQIESIGNPALAGTATLSSGGAGLALPAVSLAGTEKSLSIIANGAVTDAATVSLTGNLSVQTSTDAVTLDGANSIGGTVSVDTTLGNVAPAAVILNETGAVQLGTIAASDLTVTSGGDTNITDAVGSTISVGGTTSLTAGGDIVVNDAGENTFGGTVNLSADRITGFASANALTLGTVTTSDNNATNSFNAASSLDFAGIYTDGNSSGLSVTAGGAVTQSGGTITTDQATIVTTGDPVTLNQANDFTGAVAVNTTSGGASGAAVSLTDVDGITLGAITGSGLSVTSDDVEIGAAIALGTGTATFTNTSGAEMNFGAEPANEWGLSNIELGSITAGTVAAITNGQDFRLTDVSQLNEALSITAGTTGTVRYVGTNEGIGDFTVVSALDLAQAAGGDSLDVGGNDVSITTTDDIVVQNLTAGTATLRPGDDISIFGTNSISGAMVVGADVRDIALFAGVSDADGTTHIQVDGGSTLQAGSLELTTAGGAITANAGSLTDIATTTLTATGLGAVTVLGLEANDLVVNAGTGAVAFNDAASTFDNLTVSASASVGQNALGTITINGTGDASFTSAGPITLGADNDFTTTTVDASGTDITLNDVDDIGLGTVTATGNLTVTAGGAITDTVGEAIKVTGATSLSASGDIKLDNGLHDFDENITDDNITGDALTFLGANVTLSDVDRLTLGASTATGTTLDLTAEDFDLVGTVTVGGGTGTTTLTSPFHVLSNIGTTALTDGDGNNFNGDFNNSDAANLDTGSAIFADSGAFAGGSGGVIRVFTFDSGTAIGDVTLQATQDIVFGAGASTFRGDLSLVTGNNESVDAADEAITVLGTTSFSAGSGEVTISNANNDFQDVVSGSAGSASLADSDGIVLGDLDITNDLTVTARGTITGDGDGAAAGDDIDVGGLASLTADNAGTKQNIVLNDAFNDFSAATVDADGADITLNDVDEIGLGAITATGNLTVTAGGTITDTAGKNIDVTGTTSLLAASGGDFFDIQLDNDTAADVHSFGGAVTASGEDIHIHDIGAITLETLTPHDDSADTVDTRIAGGNGDLIVRSGAAITNLGPVTVPGDLSVTAQSFTEPTNFFDILLGFTDPLTVGGALSASGEDIFVQEASGNALEIGTVTARVDGTANAAITDFSDGSFALRSSGANDGTAGAITVAGKLFVDGAGDFVFDNDGAHSVPQLEAFAGGALGVANDVTLNTETALVLGATFSKFTITGDLTVSAEGSVTQQAPGIFSGISVGGLIVTAQNDTGTDFFDIALTDAANAITGTIAATGEDISIRNASAGGTTLGDINTNADSSADTTIDDGNDGDLTVVSTAGGIFDDGLGAAAGDDINVSGLASLSAAGDIVLDDLFNDFSTSSVDATGVEITLKDVNAIGLGAITASGNLAVTAGGTITDTDGKSISVAGTTSLLASDDISFFDIVLDNASLFPFDAHDFGGAVSASGQDIQITDVGALTLGDVTTHAGSDPTLNDPDNDGDLTLRAGTGPLVSTGVVTVAGDLNARSENLGVAGDFSDISLGAAGSVSIGGTFSAVGEDIQLVESSGNPVQIQSVTANSDATADGTLSFAGAGAGSFLLQSSGATDGTSGAITVSGTLGLNGPGGDFLFDNSVGGVGVHSVPNLNVVAAKDVRLSTSTPLTLTDGFGPFDMTGTLTLLARGTISQIAAISVGGLDATAFDPKTIATIDDDFFDILLDSAANSITGGISASGEDISITNSAEVTNLGAITAHDEAAGTIDTRINNGNDGDLTVLSTGGAIIDDAPGAITVPGTTSLTAATVGNFFDIVLDNADTHDFTGAVSATGEDIVLDDASAIVLGAIDANEGGAAGDGSADATIGLFDDDGDGALGLGDVAARGDLTVRAGGTITDTGSKIDVAGRTRLEARNAAGTLFDIVLDTPLHDFDSNAALSGGSAGDAADEVDAVGRSITLVDAGAIALGAVAASGDLTVQAGGSITDTDSLGDLEAVTVGGTTSLLARSGASFFDIALDNADTHDFTGAVSATGEDIVLDDASAIVLGAIDANEGGAAGDGSADATIGLFDDDGDGALGLGDVAARGDLTVRAGGTITDTGSKIDVAGRTRLEARNAAGTLFDIVLDTPLHDFDSNAALSGGSAGDAADEVDAVGRSITLVDAGAIALGAVAASGDLTVQAGGSITDTDSLGDLEAVTVGGTTSLLARSGASFFDIALDNADTHDFTGAVSATGEDIVLDDASAIVLGAIDANEGGAAGDGSADATIGLFDDDGDGALGLGDVAARGDLTVRAGGTITDTGSKIDVAGRTRLEARNAAGTLFDIVLDTPLHDFDSNAALSGGSAGDAADEVDAVGRSITLVDAGAIALGAVAASGDLTVQAGGSITDTDSLGDLEAVTVGGTTSLLARSGASFFDIALDNADTHDFTGAVSATGEDIVLDDASAIVLGAIDANEGGAAGDGSADATIGLFDDNGDGALGLGDVAARGDLTVRAGGTITDTGSKIDVAGRTRLEARNAAGTLFDIVLDTPLHDFDSNAALSGGSAGDAADEVDAVGRSITLADAGAIALGAVAASGDLTVQAGGSITDTDSLGDLEAVTVGGTTSLLARSGASFFDIALDNADTHDFTGAVSATGEDIVLDDASAIVLGAIDANEGGAAGDGSADATIGLFDDDGDGALGLGDVAARGDLTVRAGGTITDTGSKIDVAGRTRLEARNAAGTLFDIVLDTPLHDFDSNAALSGGSAGDAADEVDAVGRSITLVDAGAIALGAVAASGDLTVQAGGSITDTDSLGDLEAVTVGGTTSLLARSGASFFDIALDNADTHDFTGAVSATGEDIVLDDASAIVLGAIDANEGGAAGDGSADATIGLFDDDGDGALGLGDVAARGDLTVRAGGTITDTGSKIDVAGRTRLEARNAAGTLFDIVLDTPLHDFDSNAALSGGSAGDAADEVDAVGRSITLADAGAIALGAVAASGDLTVRAGGSITDTDSLGDLEAVTVGGTTSLLARSGASFFDIALDNADTHDFTGAVSATGEDIVLDDASAIVLGAIDANEGGAAGDGSADATIGLFDDNGDGALGLGDVAARGDLTVRAGGTITDTGSKIDVAGRTRLEARNAAGTLFDIVLDTSLHDFDSNAALSGGSAGDAADEVDAVGRSITLADAGAIALGAVAASGDLTVQAGGSITDTDSLGDLEAVTVGGTTSLLARSGASFFDIALDNADTHDFTGAVSATGEDIVLDDASAIVLGAIDANEGGAAGDGSADATVGLFDDDGDGALGLGDVAARGDLTVRAGGTITDTGSKIDVAGRTRLEARNAAGTLFDIVLDTPLHDFDSNAALSGGSAGDAADEVDAVGRSITLVDAGAIALGAVAASGDLTVQAGGSITDTDSLGDLEAVTVGGTTSLLARSGASFFDIALDNADTHDFTGAVSATGEDIVLDDASAIVLGAIDANEGGAAGDGSADATIGLFDDDGDGALGLGDVAARGDLTVRAGGTITDTGSKIDVAGRTRLEARNAAGTLFDIVLDTPLHDFDSNAALSGGSAGDAADEVDAVGRSITLVDAGAIALGAVAASGDLTVQAGGSITDTDSLGDLEAVTVGGTTSLLARSGASFFDIALDNADTHDFTGAVSATGEDIVIFDTADLTIASIKATSDGEADPTVADSGHGHGSIALTVKSGDFVFDPEVDDAGNAVPLQADGDIFLTAPVGSFGVLAGSEIARRQLQDGLTFRSTSGNIRLEFGNGFVVPDDIGPGPFTLDAAAGTSALIIGNPDDPEQAEFLGIGTREFLEDAQLAGFNPLFVTAAVGDAEIFRVTGNFALTSINRNSLTVRFQNSSEVPNQGDGTTVVGRTGMVGDFAGLTMFGTFNGASRSIASLQGFTDAGGFVIENGNTVNGCVIGLPSSCQPIGSLTLALDFPDGLLLGVRFINPDEDLDDPFTNRGDEEEWE